MFSLQSVLHLIREWNTLAQMIATYSYSPLLTFETLHARPGALPVNRQWTWRSLLDQTMAGPHTRKCHLALFFLTDQAQRNLTERRKDTNQRERRPKLERTVKVQKCSQTIIWVLDMVGANNGNHSLKKVKKETEQSVESSVSKEC